MTDNVEKNAKPPYIKLIFCDKRKKIRIFAKFVGFFRILIPIKVKIGNDWKVGV
jgi:hypothetical protein